MGILHKYNTSDAYIRSVIITVLEFLYEKITFTNIISDEKENIVKIPFFYSLTGADRFQQDHFAANTINDCIIEKFSEANYDRIPRGIVKLSSIAINTAELTNRFVRGTFSKEEDGVLRSYSANVQLLPLKLSFDCVVKIDTVNDAFKVIESFFTTFYRTTNLSMYWKNFPIDIAIGFPEEVQPTIPEELSFDTVNLITLNFSIEVETYLPVFDDTTEFFAGKRIENFEIILDSDIDI